MATVGHRRLTSCDEDSGGHSPVIGLKNNQYWPPQRARRHTTTILAVVLLTFFVVILTLSVSVPKGKHPKLTADSAVTTQKRRRTISFPPILSVKPPKLSTTSVTLTQVRIKLIRGSPKLNVMLTLHVSVKNPNLASLQYDESVTRLSYAGTTVAEATVPGGSCKALWTVKMIVPINVIAYRLRSAPDFVAQALRGSIPMSSVTFVYARVRRLPWGSVKVIAVRMNCDFIVSVWKRTVKNVSCTTSVDT